MNFYVIGFCILILFFIKSFLLKYAFDKKKNYFIDPEYLAEESIKKYKSQKK